MLTMLITAQDSGLMEELGVYGLPLVGSVMLTYAIFSLVRDLRKTDEKKITDRLRESEGGVDQSTEDAVKASILRQQKQESGSLGAAMSRLSLIAGLQKMLDQASISWAAGTTLINLVGLGAASFIGGYFLKLDMWVCITIGLSLILLPLGGIFVKRKMRLNKFLNQLPDVFELMSQALRAGHSLANAIMLVSQQMQEPVRSGLARVFHEQKLGSEIEGSLKNMGSRVGLMDVRFFVTAVLIQRQTGGDLAEVLDNISGVIRERLKLFGMVKALTAEGRLSGWVLLALPVVVFILELIVNPAYANQLLDTEVGQYMLITGGVMQLLGLATIQKIVNIKV